MITDRVFLVAIPTALHGKPFLLWERRRKQGVITGVSQNSPALWSVTQHSFNLKSLLLLRGTVRGILLRCFTIMGTRLRERITVYPYGNMIQEKKPNFLSHMDSIFLKALSRTVLKHQDLIFCIFMRQWKLMPLMHLAFHHL
jgi:hypothetical protein